MVRDGVEHHPSLVHRQHGEDEIVVLSSETGPTKHRAQPIEDIVEEHYGRVPSPDRSHGVQPVNYTPGNDATDEV